MYFVISVARLPDVDRDVWKITVSAYFLSFWAFDFGWVGGACSMLQIARVHRHSQAALWSDRQFWRGLAFACIQAVGPRQPQTMAKTNSSSKTHFDYSHFAHGLSEWCQQQRHRMRTVASIRRRIVLYREYVAGFEENQFLLLVQAAIRAVWCPGWFCFESVRGWHLCPLYASWGFPSASFEHWTDWIHFLIHSPATACRLFASAQWRYWTVRHGLCRRGRSLVQPTPFSFLRS